VIRNERIICVRIFVVVCFCDVVASIIVVYAFKKYFTVEVKPSGKII
jgi:hypothetical protein